MAADADAEASKSIVDPMPARIGMAEGQARRPVPPRAHVRVNIYLAKRPFCGTTSTA